MALSDKQCVPWRGEVPPLESARVVELHAELGGQWEVVDQHHLEKEYTFKNFVDALAFVNRIGAIAEEQGHHPDIALGWGRVAVAIWTHKIDALTESDFILAAKFDTVV